MSYFTKDYLRGVITDTRKFVMMRHFGKQQGEEDSFDEVEMFLLNSDTARPVIADVMAPVIEEDINLGESRLFDYLNPSDMEILLVGLHFYEFINGMSDEYLERHDFSREEIRSGLSDFLLSYGLDNISKDFLEVNYI